MAVYNLNKREIAGDCLFISTLENEAILALYASDKRIAIDRMVKFAAQKWPEIAYSWEFLLENPSDDDLEVLGLYRDNDARIRTRATF